MKITLSIEQIIYLLTPMGLLIGYLARTKVDVILLKAAVNKAHKRIDALVSSSNGCSKLCSGSKHREGENQK